MREHTRTKLTALIFATVASFALGCIAPAARAGRDADSSIAGIRAEIRELSTAFAQIETKQSAGRDVNQNDNWTMRLLGLGTLLLGLSYPIGKIVWLASSALSRRALLRIPTPSREDLMPFRQRNRNSAERIVSA